MFIFINIIYNYHKFKIPTMQESTLHFIYFLAVVGGLWFVVFIAKLLWALVKAILPQKNFTERYGENTWAIVTGGSDGIGLGFCEELADLGFNICMIARNRQKMQAALAKIRQNNMIRTLAIVADFSQCQSDNFFPIIFKEIENYGILNDISILVNNVGISNIGYLHDISEKRLLNQININCIPMVLMTHHILPSMINRNRRSAIINVSSLAGQQPIPFVSNYSATKAFNNFFSQAIELEYSEQIDVLCLQPMEVETQMSGKTKSCTVASRTQCVQAALKYLGIDYETNGYWVHRLLAWLTECLPIPVRRSLSASEARKLIDNKNEN